MGGGGARRRATADGEEKWEEVPDGIPFSRSGSIDMEDDDRREGSHAVTYVFAGTVRAVRYKRYE